MRCPPHVWFMFAASIAMPAHAQTPDPIDRALKACLDAPSGASTQGMVECIGAASAAYDKRLNEVYVQALSVLDPESKEKLRASQRAWLAFRKAEEAVYGGAWRADRGSIMRVTLANAALSALVERIQELQAYIGD